jgi:phenylacetate-CoA ligase
MMPESLKYVSAPLIRNKLIKNEEFLKYTYLLENRDTLSPESIREYQFDQLKKILIYSYRNVPYYQELFKKISFDPTKFSDFKQIEKIPFLTREIITDNFNKLKSTIKVKNGYYIGSTGGSSSVPLKFLLDYDSIFKENAFIYHYRKTIGYTFKDRIVAFRQLDYGPKLWKFNPMYNELIFFPIKLSKKTIGDYARKFNSFRPQYLNGYLSAIWFFAKLLEEYNIKLTFKIKGIFLTSENTDTKQRLFIEQFFDVKSITFYGHSERCVIAEEKNENRYIFDPYYGYTEKILDENNSYSIVGTGYINLIMPFIRYKTDDYCFMEDQYILIEGKRMSNVGLYGINDEFIASTAFELEDPVFHNITRYQFIQNEKGKADLLIIVNRDFKIQEMEVIRKEINRQTKGIIDISIKIVDNLVLSPRGKYKMYISNISQV